MKKILFFYGGMAYKAYLERDKDNQKNSRKICKQSLAIANKYDKLLIMTKQKRISVSFPPQTIRILDEIIKEKYKGGIHVTRSRLIWEYLRHHKEFQK